VPRFCLLLLLVALHSAVGHNICAQDDSKGALERIEGVRGGRHWIDQPTAPPQSAAESHACLEIEPGFEIQVIAAEPLVRDPVDITFDERGRMFVVEYGDYPVGPPEGEEPLSRIVLLEDADGDGQLDKRHIFADKLHFAHSFMAWNGGLLVGAHSEVLFLQDTDNDNIADVRQTLFDGFKPAHPQMQIGCPRWGIDNWISMTYGPGNVALTSAPEERVKLPGKDFRFDPQTMQFEADTGLGQYGNTIDRWGNRFFCTNRDPIITTLLPRSALERNPYTVVPRVQYSVGKSGGATRVYPRVEMKSNYLSHAGSHTAACGVTAYTGDIGNTALRDSVFVCEPIGHLVTRSVVGDSGARLQAKRARPKTDFLASTDTWFRPVSLSNGPDGALYLADMYRLWVEHPKFLPPEIAAKINWRAGDDKGRIYRIVPTDAPTRSYAPPTTTEQQVKLLADANGWRQYLGQRLLVEQQVASAVPELRRLLTSDQPTTRLHALWTLDGLDSVTEADVIRCLNDSEPNVRISALRLAESRLADDSVYAAVCESALHDNTRVRFQAVIALGNTDRPEATETLIQLTLKDGHDSWFVLGLLTAVRDRSAVVLCGVLNDHSFVAEGSSAKIDLVKKLAGVTGARGDMEELGLLISQITADDTPHNSIWWRAATISGLGTGLSRHRGNTAINSLPKLLNTPPESLASSAGQLQRLLKSYQDQCLDPSRSVADRVAAVELLKYRPFAESSIVFDEMLSSGQPIDLQSAAVRALSSHANPHVAEIIIERWSEISPAVRTSALALLQRRTEFTQLMLAAMKAGQVNASALSVDQRVLLLKHSNDAIRSTATELLGGAVSENRQAVAKQYQEALTLPATSEAGAKVFKRVCSRCHRVDGVGHEAGPDISDVRNRSRSAILFDILDPNSKVEPQFSSYTVVTIDGRTFSGLLASETADNVVLRMAEGREQAIGREQIEEMRASDVSLMPEGIEKDVTVQNMADLLEFLKNR